MSKDSKKIIMYETFFSGLRKLGAQDYSATMDAIEKMRKDLSNPSLSVHDIDKVKCDKRLRSARVSLNIRLIFLLSGDDCILVYVDHHDAAYDWCKGKYFEETVFGALYINDSIKEKECVDKYDEAANYAMWYETQNGFEKNGVTLKQLKKLGINEIHAKNLLSVKNDDVFLDYIVFFPDELQEALIDLFSGEKSFEEAYRTLEVDSETVPEYKVVDESASMFSYDGMRRVYVCGSAEDIKRIAEAKELNKWMFFLHPSQKRLVSINAEGPVLVEGGPGTGKTVLAIHRAVYLAQNVYKKSEGKRILLCTYSKKLAKYISHNVEILCKQLNVENNIDVLSVDSFIGKRLGTIVPQPDLKGLNLLFKQTYVSKKWKYPLSFYKDEYMNVIERLGIYSLDVYLEVERHGRKKALGKNERTEVWQYFAELFSTQREKGIYSFGNKAYMLSNALERGQLLPTYDAILIDETQDLEPIKIKALSRCVKSLKNGLMLFSDSNQRIFNLFSWKNEVDINVVGRSYYLNVNYRTTKQISDFALNLLPEIHKKEDYLKNYKSIVMGNMPIRRKFPGRIKEFEAIISTIDKLAKMGIKRGEVCVAFPNGNEMDRFIESLTQYQIDYEILKDDTLPESGEKVNICTCKAIKGLEFDCIIMACSELYQKDFDAFDELMEAKKEQTCFEQYVVATRARDYLFVTGVEG